MWVGNQDMFVHRFQMMLASNGTGTGPESIDLSVELTVTFRDFNAPVSIVAPANAQPLDLGPAIRGSIPGMPGVIGMVPGMSGSPMAGMPRTGDPGGQTLLLALGAVGMACIVVGLLVRRRAMCGRPAS
jgi:hypothetical protein